MLGACSAMASMTASPKASRCASSHVSPGFRWYGAYCTKHDITCLPGGASAGSTQRRNDHVDVGPAREVAVLRVVVGPLHVVDARRNRDGAAQMLAAPGQAGEVGQRVERQVDLAGRAAELVAAHAFQELVGQFRRRRGSARRTSGADRRCSRPRRPGSRRRSRAPRRWPVRLWSGSARPAPPCGSRRRSGAPRRRSRSRPPPVPPRDNPQERNAPSISPM